VDHTALLLVVGAGALAVRAAAKKHSHTGASRIFARLGQQPARADDGTQGPVPDFPEAPSARDAFILDAVRKGQAEIRWAPVRSSFKEHQAEFRVFADAMKIGGIRVNLTAIGQQHVADQLGCMLLTLMMADLLWSQRQVELRPVELSKTQHDIQVMSTVERMVLHSRTIDEMIRALPQPPEGIVSTVGKHWIINDVLAQPKKLAAKAAMNYGWNNRAAGNVCATPAGVLPPGGPPCRVVQDPGTFHNFSHLDYSQTCTLMDGTCTVDGQTMSVAKLLQDPVLSHLASSTGPMKVLRQPGA
jgi:hypothetical protein